MKYYGKIRSCVWIDPRLNLLLSERGMTLSSFLSRTLPPFLDLPEDPRDKLIQAKMDEIVFRARNTYEREMKELMKDFVKENVLKNAAETKETDRAYELLNIGDSIKSLKFYPIMQRCLQDPDKIDDYWTTWEDAAAVLSSNHDKKYEANSLWGNALEWWRLYGKNQTKATP